MPYTVTYTVVGGLPNLLKEEEHEEDKEEKKKDDNDEMEGKRR